MKSSDLNQAGLLELILKSLGEGVIVADREGKILLMNPMAMKIMGQSPGETPYDEWTDTYGIFRVDGTTPLPTDEIPLVRALRGEAFKGVELFMRNHKIPDGVYMSCTGSPLQGEQGELVGGVVIFRDITREIRSIHLFKEKAGRVLFDLAKTYAPDRDSALRWITEAGARMLGVERVSIWLFSEKHGEMSCENLFTLSRGVHERGSSLSAARFPRYFQALEESRLVDASDAQIDPRTSEFTQDYLKPQGIVSMLDVPIRLHGGVVGVVCHEHVGELRRWTLEEKDFATSTADLVSLSLEAEERRKLERESAKNLSLLRATLESTADGILVVDVSGKIVSYNRKFVEMWRIPQDIVESADDERALAFVLEQLVQPDAFLKKVKDLYAQPEAESLDVLTFKDGRIIERYSKPQEIGDAVVGRVWSFRDVTTERRAYEEMKKVNQLKTNLASMISHELRTPLTVIQESVGIVLDGLDGPLEAAQRKTLQIAKGNAEWLGRLIHNFLSFTKIESGMMRMDVRKVDARALIEDACRLMKPSADRKGLSIAKFLPGEAVDVEWDGDKIKSAVINLIDNAIKYTEAPGHIRVRLKSEGSQVEIEVEDTGIGVREEDKPGIFDMFAQAAERGPWNTGGFGVGLAICKYVAEHHGGSLTLESQYGKGSLFRFRLPRTRPDGCSR